MEDKYKHKKPKKCEICGVDISHRHFMSKMCLDCSSSGKTAARKWADGKRK